MKQAADSNSNQPVAWVTGSGAPRVGRCIANHFAKNGYRIVVHSHTPSAEASRFVQTLKSEGTDSMLVTGAVESPEFSQQATREIVDRFGRLDVLVNSAAIWDWQPFDKITSADLLRQFEVNAMGTFLCCQAAGLQMTRQPFGGAILLIGDWAVHRPYIDFSPYFVSKGSIETMTRSLAVELALRNPAIRVNAILPGTVLLDPSIPESAAKRIHERCLLGIPGKPEHIAEAALFLAKHEFITGVALPVDGGRCIYSNDGQDAHAHPTYAHRSSSS